MTKLKLSIGVGESFGHAVASAEGNLYCAGGYRDSDGYRHAGSFVMFKKGSNVVTSLNNTNQERSYFGFTYMDGHLYAVGGSRKNTSNNVNTPVDSVERYNISSGRWQNLHRLPQVLKVCSKPSLTIFEHSLLVAGSTSSSNNHVVLLFKPKTQTWHTLLCRNLGAYSEIYVHATNGKVYLIGFHTVESNYTTSSNWTTCPTVYECNCCVSGVDSSPTFTIGETTTQKFVPETNMRVFRIGSQVYIIISGHIYKTGVTIDDDHQNHDVDLSGYSCLKSVDNHKYAVTSHNIDRKYFK